MTEPYGKATNFNSVRDSKPREKRTIDNTHN